MMSNTAAACTCDTEFPAGLRGLSAAQIAEKLADLAQTNMKRLLAFSSIAHAG